MFKELQYESTECCFELNYQNVGAYFMSKQSEASKELENELFEENRKAEETRREYEKKKREQVIAENKLQQLQKEYCLAETKRKEGWEQLQAAQTEKERREAEQLLKEAEQRAKLAKEKEEQQEKQAIEKAELTHKSLLVNRKQEKQTNEVMERNKDKVTMYITVEDLRNPNYQQLIRRAEKSHKMQVIETSFIEAAERRSKNLITFNNWRKRVNLENVYTFLQISDLTDGCS